MKKNYKQLLINEKHFLNSLFSLFCTGVLLFAVLALHKENVVPFSKEDFAAGFLLLLITIFFVKSLIHIYCSFKLGDNK